MSFNIELPSESSLKLLAPQKDKAGLLSSMRQLTTESRQFREEKRKGLFLPAGQTTQMIIGASPETDGQIIRLSQSLYRGMGLKRVYYSSYVPVVHDNLLPDIAAGPLREHRLYQADWLLRFYGFHAEELAPKGENLPLEYDPKCAWALKHMQFFPVEINRAPTEVLLRVPGIGAKSAYRISEARKYTALTFSDLVKMRVVMKRAKHFITCGGKFIGTENPARIGGLLAAGEAHENAEQLSLFSQATSALTGEL